MIREIHGKYRGHTGEIHCSRILSGKFLATQHCIHSAASEHMDLHEKYSLNIGEIQEKYRGRTGEIQEKYNFVGY